MTKIAAFHWNAEASILSYMVIDGSSFDPVPSGGPLIEKKINTLVDVRNFISNFIDVLKANPDGGQIEHHVAIENTDPRPSKFSLDVKRFLKERLEEIPEWVMADTSVQGMTTEGERETLKAGLRSLDLWKGVHGTTYEIDLWTIAMHHRDPKKCLRDLWRAEQETFRRWTKEKREQYDEWYGDLAA